MYTYKSEEIRRLSLNAVAEKLGLSRSKLYLLMATDPTFPKPCGNSKATRQSRVYFFGPAVDAYILKSFGKEDV